jgi:hypothetical protein
MSDNNHTPLPLGYLESWGYKLSTRIFLNSSKLQVTSLFATVTGEIADPARIMGSSRRTSYYPIGK